jgi:hypothetical protein
MGFKILKEIPALFGKKYWLYTLELNWKKCNHKRNEHSSLFILKPQPNHPS